MKMSKHTRRFCISEVLNLSVCLSVHLRNLFICFFVSTFKLVLSFGDLSLLLLKVPGSVSSYVALSEHAYDLQQLNEVVIKWYYYYI